MYSDESNWNKGRYRSIGAVSVPVGTRDLLADRLSQILADHGISEAKWQDVRDARRRAGAESVLRELLSEAVAGTARIHAIVWDTRDSRHDVVGRDDHSNLGRMHYHLYRHVCRQWPPSVWAFLPDEHGTMDWDMLGETLWRTGRRREGQQALFDGRVGTTYRVLRLDERQSLDEPLLQAADLVAGMVAYSRDRFDRYRIWKDQQSGQGVLFGQEEGSTLSRRDVYRWELIESFWRACRQHKLQVSLESTAGLRSRAKGKSIDFWWYEPQGSYDQAPVS